MDKRVTCWAAWLATQPDEAFVAWLAWLADDGERLWRAMPVTPSGDRRWLLFANSLPPRFPIAQGVVLSDEELACSIVHEDWELIDNKAARRFLIDWDARRPLAEVTASAQWGGQGGD